LPSSVNVM